MRGSGNLCTSLPHEAKMRCCGPRRFLVCESGVIRTKPERISLLKVLDCNQDQVELQSTVTATRRNTRRDFLGNEIVAMHLSTACTTWPVQVLMNLVKGWLVREGCWKIGDTFKDTGSYYLQKLENSMKPQNLLK